MFSTENHTMKKLLFIAILSLCSINLFSAQLDTISIFSSAMKKEIMCAVITPNNIGVAERLPVVYMLHGHGGSYATWANNFNTQNLADAYHVMIVCPDGEYSSWYWDSPIDPKIRYETFVSSELIKYIDSNYYTIKSREGRAITGFSMGGHGALYLSFRHQETFGAAGSMSGGVDIRPFPNSWNMKDRLGDKATHPQNWDDYTVMSQLHLLKPSSLALIIDCGTEDFFYDVNETLHKELLDKKIPHKYMTGAGAHNGKYWGESIMYHMLFFDNYFKMNNNL